MSAQLAINRGESRRRVCVPCLYIFHVVVCRCCLPYSHPLLLLACLPSCCLLIYRVFCVVAHINHKADTRRFTHVWRLADADATAPRRQAKATTTRTTAKNNSSSTSRYQTRSTLSHTHTHEDTKTARQGDSVVTQLSPPPSCRCQRRIALLA